MANRRGKICPKLCLLCHYRAVIVCSCCYSCVSRRRTPAAVTSLQRHTPSCQFANSYVSKQCFESCSVCCLTTQVRGFFRGLSSPLIGGAAETGVNYVVYSRVLDLFRPHSGQHYQHLQPHPSIKQQVKQQQLTPYQQQLQQGLLQQQDPHSNPLPPMYAVPVAAAVAGAALSVILSPTELIKCRMQMAQFDSPIRCLQNVLQTEGLQGLSRGFIPTLCREVPGNAIFFTVYEGLRRNWPGRPPAGHDNTSGATSNSSSESRRSSSALAKAWQIILDAGGAIICGGIAGVVVSLLLVVCLVLLASRAALPLTSSWSSCSIIQLRSLCCWQAV